MAARVLDIWLHDELVAHVTERRTGTFQLRYTDAALQRWHVGRPLVSISMPLTPAAFPPSVVGPFLEGLLPEGEARVVLEEGYGVRRGDVAGLLGQIGRDCAGAVMVLPAGAERESHDGATEPIDDDALARMLRALPDRPLGDDEQVRVSLAGQQSKLLLAQDADGGWHRPLAGTPSTHILKPADQRYPDVAANEVLCLRLARELGLSHVDAELLDVDGIDVVVVSRYDRRSHGGRTERLHQEDACQALAVDVGPRGAGKYEAAGGPSFADVAHLLDVHNGDPVQTGRLLEAATFTVVIGNADAHGKNVSFLLSSDGRVFLAPLYDVMSTVHYPQVEGPMGPARVSTELAMHIDGTREIDAVDVGALAREGGRWHHADDVEDRINELLARFDAALDAAAAAVPRAPDRLVERIRARADRLRRGATAGT